MDCREMVLEVPENCGLRQWSISTETLDFGLEARCRSTTSRPQNQVDRALLLDGDIGSGKGADDFGWRLE